MYGYAKLARNSGELTAEIDLLGAGLSNILCRLRFARGGEGRGLKTSIVNQAEESPRRVCSSAPLPGSLLINDRLTDRDKFLFLAEDVRVDNPAYTTPPTVFS